jgi:hypothetical protein
MNANARSKFDPMNREHGSLYDRGGADSYYGRRSARTTAASAALLARALQLPTRHTLPNTPPATLQTKPPATRSGADYHAQARCHPCEVPLPPGHR